MPSDERRCLGCLLFVLALLAVAIWEEQLFDWIVVWGLF